MIRHAPLPLPLQLAGSACQWRTRVDNCMSNILNHELTTVAVIHYYTASARGRLLHCGSRRYYTFQNTTPHTSFSPHSLSSILPLGKPSCLLCGCSGRMGATLCPQKFVTLTNWLHCLDMKPAHLWNAWCSVLAYLFPMQKCCLNALLKNI